MSAGLGVETNQHVQLNYNPASTFDRILAFVIDAILILIYSWVVNSIWDVVTPSEFSFQSNYSWLLYLFVVLPIMFYHLLMEVTWKGYSIGKKLVGIRVTKIDGSRPQIGDYITRWLFRLFEITMTGGLVAILTTLLNGKGQRLGDISAGTAVIKSGRRITLEQTILAEIDLNYKPIFNQVIELTDDDVTIIREVLNARKNYDEAAWIKMMGRTRKLIEKKIGAVNKDLDTRDYLLTIIKDYNALHGSI